MAAPRVHHTLHETEVAAPAELVYALVADVTAWPRIFPPTVHAEVAERTGGQQRILIWATAGETVKHWTSRRILDPGALRVEFRQEVSQHPVASMGGAWEITATGDGTSRVVLAHDYTAVGGTPDNEAWIAAAVERNSTAELAALKANAESESAAGLVLSFQDELAVHGQAKDLFDFVDQAGLWAERLPHVDRVALVEEAPGVQRLSMDTLTADGATHTTESVRLCFPHERIVYKQLKVPALMKVHTGAWTFTDTGDGAVITSAHTVVLNPDAVPRVLGADATLSDARDFVRAALGRNSTTTMRHAKDYAEGNAST
ncbi:aromatase/cyclase [Streptomyces sp. NPDC001034]|uniref:aromatase/cyclase n=1 Tax=Streptomyces sp. NPDC001034 TaxID=3154375 RepID=UPI00332DBDDA